MAGLLAIVIALIAVHLGHADAEQFSLSAGPCPGIPEVDWSGSIKTYLRNIPNNITLPMFYANTRDGALEIGPPRLHGLGTMWTFKPYYTYCTGKETFVEVPAFAHEQLVVDVDWKMCSGSSGGMGIKTFGAWKEVRDIISQGARPLLFLYKIRRQQPRSCGLLFKALPTAEDPTHLELSKIQADVLEDVEAYLTGAPLEISKVVNYASFLMPHQVKRLWSFVFRLDGEYLVTSHPPEMN